MFFIIGIWGGAKRIHATYQFVLYTSIGSLCMLFSLLYLMVHHYQTTQTVSFDFTALITQTLPIEVQTLLFAGFALAFIIKIPVPPFHLWLPYAHVEAPAAGSMILAAILLKMGAYGFIKFACGLFPMVLSLHRDFLMIFFLLGAFYAGAIAFVQEDLKQ
jgi:NADH-quinone oxidoreductase subunit M